MKRKLITFGLVLVTGAGAAYLSMGSQASSEPLKVQILAASTKGERRAIVQLRWLPEAGWIPSGGFNIYRRGGKSPDRPLNREPIRPSAKVLESTTFKTAALGLRAARGVFDRTKLESSAPAFAATRAEVNKVLSRPEGVSGRKIEKLIAEVPAMKALNNRLAVPKARNGLTAGPRTGLNLTAQRTNEVGDSDINAARDTLRLAALTDMQAARDLGLVFFDEDAEKDVAYTYEVRAITPKGEVSVGKLDFTPGREPLPPTPVVELPLQLEQHRAAIHFSLPAGVDPSDYGLLKFDVFRASDARSDKPINKDPILLSFHATNDQKVVESVVTFEDPIAPTGRVDYEVVATDVFGRKSLPARVSFTMLDIASPMTPPAVVAVGPIQRPEVGPRSAVVYWVEVPYANDEFRADGKPEGEPYKSAMRYSVTRLDDENERLRPELVEGTPRKADLTKMPAETLAALLPELAERINAFTAGSSKKTAADFFAEFAALTVDDHILELRDKDMPSDRFYRFQVSTTLVRSGKAGEPGFSAKVGIPATVMPSAPTGLALSDKLAGSRPEHFSAISGTITNAASIQREPGFFVPDLVEPTQTNRAAFSTKVFAQARAKARSIGAARSNPIVGVPANYGRVVTVSWTAPSYVTPLRYRVYRAVGTGYRTLSGAPTALALSNPSLIVATGPTALRAAPRATIGTRSPSDMSLKRVSRAIPAQQGRGKVSAPSRSMGLAQAKYAEDFAPSEAEYTLLGTTNFGETKFTDLTPRSQVVTYYYKVVAVNRWGSAGAASNPTKRRLNPSMPPTEAKLVAAVPGDDREVKVQIDPSIVDEDVVRYDIYRIEGGLTPPPTPPATTTNVAPGVVAVRPNYAVEEAGPSQAAGISGHLNPGAATGPTMAPSSAARRFSVGSQANTMIGYTAFQSAPGVAAAMTPDVGRLLDLKNYTKIGSVSVAPTDPGPFEYLDKGLVEGKSYAYRVVAVNTANLASLPSTILDAIPFKTVADPPTLSGSATNSEDGVTFDLVPPASGAKAFLIERAIVRTSGNRFKSLGVLVAVAPKTRFIDRGSRTGARYIYRIRTLDGSGNLSRTSLDIPVAENQ